MNGARKRAVVRKVGPPPGSEAWPAPWVELRSAAFHPFIYKRMVRSASADVRSGDVVAVFDKKGSRFGSGFYNPRSQIALRMLAFDDRPIDEGFFRGLLQAAVDLRRNVRPLRKSRVLQEGRKTGPVFMPHERSLPLMRAHGALPRLYNPAIFQPPQADPPGRVRILMTTDGDRVVPPSGDLSPRGAPLPGSGIVPVADPLQVRLGPAALAVPAASNAQEEVVELPITHFPFRLTFPSPPREGVFVLS
jgi:hypothetical protein